MSKRQKEFPEPDFQEETKTRIPVWLYPSTLDAVDRAVEANHCKSRSDFLEKAAQFYAGYLSGQDAISYLPPALVSAVRATVQASEDRICRLLFKLAVEQDMTMNVLAAVMPMKVISEEYLAQLAEFEALCAEQPCRERERALQGEESTGEEQK